MPMPPGFHHKSETKQKISLALKGKFTPERLAKLHAKIGSNNPMWKGDLATGQAAHNRAIRKYPCPEGKERHHIDGNPYNNDPSNIMFVTRREHMIIDGRLLKMPHTGRKRKMKPTQLLMEAQKP